MRTVYKFRFNKDIGSFMGVFPMELARELALDTKEEIKVKYELKDGKVIVTPEAANLPGLPTSEERTPINGSDAP